MGSPSRDIEVLAEFINIYCGDYHNDREKEEVRAGGEVGQYVNPLKVRLCDDCKKLLLHAASKRIVCPYHPKPACKKCPTHCYAPGYREKIREVMRYSGKRLIKKGRLDLVWKYIS